MIIKYWRELAIAVLCGCVWWQLYNPDVVEKVENHYYEVTKVETKEVRVESTKKARRVVTETKRLAPTGQVIEITKQIESEHEQSDAVEQVQKQEQRVQVATQSETTIRQARPSYLLAVSHRLDDGSWSANLGHRILPALPFYATLGIDFKLEPRFPALRAGLVMEF